MSSLLRLVSDIHLEQYRNVPMDFLVQEFIPPHIQDKDSVLILAGDISSNPQQLLEFLSVLESRFKKCIFVPGNHEFYETDMASWRSLIEEQIPQRTKNVVFSTTNVLSIVIDGVRYILGTLWCGDGLSYGSTIIIGSRINDFTTIRVDENRPFRVYDAAALNRIHKEEIRRILKEPFDGQTVVITHHLPSFSLCHERFDSSFNGAFANNLDSLFYEPHAPDVWIHGHTHDTIDTMIGETRIVCNPYGYSRENGLNEFNTFRQGPKFIELN